MYWASSDKQEWAAIVQASKLQLSVRSRCRSVANCCMLCGVQSAAELLLLLLLLLLLPAASLTAKLDMCTAACRLPATYARNA